MAHVITEVLYFDDGSRRFHFQPGVRNGCVVEAGRYYSFGLHRKSARFGDVAIDQFWMAHDGVYGRHGKQARNYDVLVEYFWARCKHAATVFDDEVMDSYILAKLLPYVRRNGSRRVFDDAVLTGSGRFQERSSELLAQLDRQLAAGRKKMLNLSEFHSKTADLLGPPTFEEDVLQEYAALSEELLGEGRKAVGRWGDDGLQVPIAKLQSWMNTFARRRGNETKKLALDMLSYECRAAMHRCYSSVWYDLLTHLERKYRLDEASVQFHRLMHFDIQLPSQLRDANFHLFHGHVFALHPGISLFLQTRTGGELIADYLSSDDQGRPFARLLNGLLVGLFDYYLRSADCAQLRKSAVSHRQVDDITAISDDRVGKNWRRSKGKRKRKTNRSSKLRSGKQSSGSCRAR